MVYSGFVHHGCLGVSGVQSRDETPVGVSETLSSEAEDFVNWYVNFNILESEKCDMMLVFAMRCRLY